MFQKFPAKSKCHLCSQLLQEAPQQLVLLYLCRHTVHARCARPNGDETELPQLPDPALRGVELSGVGGRGLSGRIALCESFIVVIDVCSLTFILVKGWFELGSDVGALCVTNEAREHHDIESGDNTYLTWYIFFRTHTRNYLQGVMNGAQRSAKT